VRPLVGVTAGSSEIQILEGTLPAYYAGRANPRAVVRAGGDPVLLGAVPEADERAAERYADAFDAFVLAGGVDISPSRYGGAGDGGPTTDHARDAFEIALVQAARARGKPVLGVCRGMEILVVALGGTLVDTMRHSVRAEPMEGFSSVVRHEIALERGSLAARVYATESIAVACLHHQSPDVVPDALTVSGVAEDGVIEAVEGQPDEGFLLGLLWHPEYLADRYPEHLRPYRALIEAALERG
jgi:putative glutamine amidotransferase